MMIFSGISRKSIKARILMKFHKISPRGANARVDVILSLQIRMNRYRVLKVLGDGSFGTVLEAQNSENNERVRRS